MKIFLKIDNFAKNFGQKKYNIENSEYKIWSKNLDKNCVPKLI